MKPYSFLLSAALSAILVSCTGSPGRTDLKEPVIVTQVPLGYLDDSTRQTYLDDLRNSGVSVVLVSLEDVFCSGAERDSLMARLGRAIRLFEGEGYEVGVWTNTLGYGYPRPQLDTLVPGIRYLTSFEGNTGNAVCATDKGFLELMKDNVRDFARAGARFILIDDDLVQGVRPGFACVCEGHLALLKEATGRDFTREQVRDLFTGDSSAERTAYMDILGGSMEDFCRGLREAVDEVDPGIVMSICSSYTHFDAEGVDMEEIARLLAGKGHTPFLRLSGATYWPVVAPRFPGETLGDVLDFVRMQTGWFRGRGVVLFDENDPYPRKSDIVPEEWCEIYDKVMMAGGGVNRHKYMCCYTPQDPDRAYVEAHLSDKDDDPVLLDMFAGTSPCGFRVWNAEHLVRETTLPDEYPGNYQMMVRASHSAAAVFLGANSIPACFEGKGFPGIVFGDQARLLPPGAAGHGLVLDVPAALALISKGMDVGLERAVPLQMPEYEIFGTDTVAFGAAGGTFFGLVPREDAEAEVISSFVSGGEVVPSCLLCRTRDGLFAIYGWDGYDQLFRQPRNWGGGHRAAQLKELYRRMAGGESLDAAISGTDGLYMLAARSSDGGRLSVLVCNPSDKAAPEQDLEVPEGWVPARSLRTEVSAEPGGFRLPEIPPMGWCAVELKK